MHETSSRRQIAFVFLQRLEDALGPSAVSDFWNRFERERVACADHRVYTLSNPHSRGREQAFWLARELLVGHPALLADLAFFDPSPLTQSIILGGKYPWCGALAQLAAVEAHLNRADFASFVAAFRVWLASKCAP